MEMIRMECHHLIEPKVVLGGARQATPEDWNALSPLFQAYKLTTDHHDGRVADAAEQQIYEAAHKIALTEGEYWVWEVANSIVCLARLNFGVEAGRAYGELGEAFTADEFKNNGYGANLAALLCKVCAAKEALPVVTTLSDDEPAMALYTSLGFTAS